MKIFQRIWRFLIIFLLMMATVAPTGTSLAFPIIQEDDPASKASALISQLTPAEKVGQLFLVTFEGTQAETDSQIYKLISQYHIGGIMLMSSNNNFSQDDTLVNSTYDLITNLQQIGWYNSQENVTPEANAQTESAQTYIPLFIAISQEGDGYPNDQILSGVTALPNELAIGATWNRDTSLKIGEILGSELQALGVNMLFGPSLDVLDQTYDSSSDDQGSTTFGGDPYWVQELGSAYVDGVHQGSQNKIAVIAKHFPGLGSSDRSPDEEVATVRKTLEQLQQFELPPFMAVTGEAASEDTTVEGLLISHIRYLFQGNIRATTRPVSLDSSALQNLMSLTSLQTWQSSGGLLVSDDLGSRALRRFYDPSEQEFDARQVAREAFLAGNDLLYADNFTSTDDPDSYTSLVDTIDFFAQKYTEDDAFAQRVDQSLLKILTLKFRLYPEFTLDSVTPSQDNLVNVGDSTEKDQILFDVARNAVTLISPDSADLPDPPNNRERLVFITDTSSQKQCDKCSVQSSMAVDALQNEVLRLYGPQSGAQVSQSRMASYSFSELLKLLDGTQTTSNEINTPEPTALEQDLNNANWIIFSMQNSTSTRSESTALKRVLNERPDILRDKTVVVFAFNAPYYLDATDISKLSAYYALYSKTEPFIEVAARVLFQEITPAGSSPVSIPGIGYNIIEVTSPDPDQVIGLGLDTTQVIPETEEASTATLTVTGTTTVTPTETPTFKKGDVIPLLAGPVIDHNGRPVPDGTVVNFIFTMDGGANGEQQVEAMTTGGTGMASTTYKIDREGLLEISVTSDEATRSYNLKLNISEGAGAAVSVIQPTEMPTPTITATPTPTETPIPTQEPTPEPMQAPGVSDWFIAVMISFLVAGGVGYAGFHWTTLRWGLRWGLCVLLGGLFGYSYLALGFPGSAELVKSMGTSGVVLMTVIGMLVGSAVGLGWWRWQEMDPTRRF